LTFAFISVKCFYCGSSYTIKVGEDFFRCHSCDMYYRKGGPYKIKRTRARREEAEAPPVEVSYELEFEKFLESIRKGAKKMGHNADQFPKSMEEFRGLPEDVKKEYREAFILSREGAE